MEMMGVNMPPKHPWCLYYFEYLLCEMAVLHALHALSHLILRARWAFEVSNIKIHIYS